MSSSASVNSASAPFIFPSDTVYEPKCTLTKPESVPYETSDFGVRKIQNPVIIQSTNPDDQVASKLLRVVCISDTHNHLAKYIQCGLIPDGDILLHSGDFTNRGKDEEVKAFNEALAFLPHKYKVVISGNHEAGLNKMYTVEQIKTQILTNATHYLHHESIVIEGIKIFGSPYTDCGPAHTIQFPLGPQLAAKWEDIPADTDILMTHIPAWGILDLAYDPSAETTANHDKPAPPPAEWNVPDEVVSSSNRNNLMASIRAKVPKPVPKNCEVCNRLHKMYAHWGCPDLNKKIRQIKPKVHLCGHVHDTNGVRQDEDTVFINASMDFMHYPVVFEVLVQS